MTNPVAPVPSLEEQEIRLEGYDDGETRLRAYVKGDRLCICGMPPFTVEDSAHNCDQMGCPSIDHVLARFTLPADLHTREPALPLNEVAGRLFAWAEEGRIPAEEAHWMIAACGREPAPLDRERALLP